MPSLNLDIHFKELFEDTSDLIHFLKLDGTIELVNPAWLKNLEYTLDEVVGKPIFNFIDPDYHEQYAIYRDGIINSKRLSPIQTVLISKSGNPIYAEGKVTCRFADNEPLYTRAVFKNITNQYTAERLLSETEKRLHTFFNYAPDAIVIIDHNDVIEGWNPKAEEIFGFSHHEVVGEKMSHKIIPPEYRKAHLRGMAHFLVTGEGPLLNKSIEITALHKLGHEFFISLNISSVKMDDKWLFIAFVTDITDQRRIKEELLKKETELIKSKILDDKKDEFLSIASHELKTPLTTIKAYTQLALAVADSKYPDVVAYLKKANAHTDKLTYLINELLDVSKIQAGKLNVSLVEVQFNVFLKDILSSLQHITPSHQITFSGCPKCRVKLDPLRIEQVITNFISNAAKYSPGQKKIDVTCVCNGDVVTVSVTDYGIGIPAENLSKIFNRFYRVDQVTENFTGLGIGLFISAQIIRQHEGDVAVKSTPGQGSVFSFSLPLLKSQDAI